MTPKEKARELVGKFTPYADVNDRRENLYNAKQCALIAVDMCYEVALPMFYADSTPLDQNMKSYWLEVKQEIEKI